MIKMKSILIFAFLYLGALHIWGQEVLSEGFEQFETGPFTGNSTWAISGTNVQITDSVAREGKQAIVFFIPNEGTDYRSEIARSGFSRYHEAGETWWYGYSTYMYPDYEVSKYTVAMSQTHSRISAGNSPLTTIRLRPGKRKDQFARSPSMNDSLYNSIGPKDGIYVAEQGKKEILIGKVSPGKWVDWVWTIHWSTSEEGKVQLWKDGVIVFENNAKNVGLLDGAAGYEKYGLYAIAQKKQSESKDIKVVFDAIRIAQLPWGDKNSLGYKAVAPKEKTAH